jgi:hypothetical protein
MNPNTLPSPSTGDDTADIIDDALTALAERRGLWLDDHNIIHLLASLIAQAERELPLAISLARGDNTSWDQIGQLLGTSSHEAQLRYNPASPVADRRWPFEIT